MGESSIKRNFLYRSILGISSYLVIFFTYPYVSRVFGVEVVGLINFVDNTVCYFIMFASLGINILGVREIASVKDDNQARSKVFSNLLGVNLLFTMITIVVYFLIICSIPRLRQYSELFYIGSAKILFTTFLIEWFYTGIENFKYITLRSLIIKLCYIVAIFVFIQERTDYVLYWIFTVSLVVLNAVVNCVYAQRYVRVRLQELFCYKYLRSNILLGGYAIMTSMYLTFNVMYLGLVTNNTQVGYYTTAFKLYTIILGFFSAYTNVMLPRMSSILSVGDKAQFQSLLTKSITLIVTYSIPLICCAEILAPQVISVLSGHGFEEAVVPMRIIMPAIFFVGIAQVLAIQMLMPLAKDVVLLRGSILGALVSVILNILLVGTLGCIGSAIVLLLSEFVVSISYIIYAAKQNQMCFPVKQFLVEVACTIPLALIAYIVTQWFDNPFHAVGVSLGLLPFVWMLINKVRYNRWLPFWQDQRA